MQDLTNSQKRVLDAFRADPTASYESIGQGLDPPINKNTVAKHIKNLEKKGYVQKRRVRQFIHLTPKANGPDSMLQLQS